MDTNDSSDQQYIFVVSTDNKWYAGKKVKGTFHHSSFLSGAATIGSGYLKITGGKLVYFKPESGHYRPK